MRKKDRNYWFRAKNYGWGWYPSSWQGWLVLLIWVIFFTFFVVRIKDNWKLNLLFIFLSIGILIFICWKTGEKPRWRWGKE